MLRCLLLILLFAVPVLALPSFTLDRSFGAGGKVVHSLGIDAFTQKIIAQPDGKIVVFGMMRAEQSPIWILRFNNDGSLDISFGMNGLVTTPLHTKIFEAWHAGILLPDGSFVVGGSIGQ